MSHSQLFTIETERLKIHVASREEMERYIAVQTYPELIQAYGEMLQGCIDRPEQWAWYAIWMIGLKNGTHVGDLSFKGFNADGSVKIESPQVIINGTYTISDGEINLTYQGSKDEVFPSKYAIKDNTLTYMDTVYVREGSGATVDQPFLTMQENPEATEAEAKSDAKSDAKEESK